MSVIEKTLLLVRIAQAENRGDKAAAGHLKKKLAALPSPSTRGTK